MLAVYLMLVAVLNTYNGAGKVRNHSSTDRNSIVNSHRDTSPGALIRRIALT